MAQREMILERISNGEMDSKEGTIVLESLNKILGNERAVDSLVDKWERELAEGKMPNLDEVDDE